MVFGGDKSPGVAAEVANDVAVYPAMTVMSVSFGDVESDQGAGVLQAFSQTFAQLAAASDITFADQDGNALTWNQLVGGIIPPEDAEVLRGKGVAAVFTPKDFQLGRIVDELLTLVERHRQARASVDL